MKPAFDPVWPWPLLLLAIALLVGTLWLGYPRRIAHLPRKWRNTLVAVRSVIIAMIVLLLLRPYLILESDEKSDAVIYLVMDRSASMATKDAAGNKTRHQALQDLFEKLRPSLDEIGEDIEVRIRELSAELEPVDGPSEVADGRITNICGALNSLAQAATQEKTGAVIFLSDGRDNGALSSGADPLRAARLLGRQNSPVYAVGFGSSEAVSNGADIALSELDVPSDVFVRNEVPVRVRLRTFGFQGQDVRLRVLIEQRIGLGFGKSGAMAPVPPSASNKTLRVITLESSQEDETVSLQFIPEEAGEIKIAVEAEPIDEEIRQANNRVETVIRVRSGGIRVAYFDRIRPEMKWLKRINVSSRVQLDVVPILGGALAERNVIGDRWFDDDAYDAYIIGDVPASVLGEARIRRLYRLCQDRGVGLMMIGGQDSFGRGGYHQTPLASLLPVVISGSDQQLTDPVPVVPTQAGIRNPILQIASLDQNLARWRELAPMEGANVFRLKEGTAPQVLAESANGMPMLVTQSTGSGRVMVFAGDTTWQWALQEDWAVEAHQRFWRQVIFWLTRMEEDGENKAWISVEPRQVMPGGNAEMSFGLRGEDGLPVKDANYKLDVIRPDGETSNPQPRAEALSAAADFTETDDPGDYWVRLEATGPDGTTHQHTTRFLVNNQDPELDNPAADPGLLREIAHVSGGDFLSGDELQKRLEEWAEDGLPGMQIKRSRSILLWDNWFVLLAFVGLMTAEWAIRKKRGLV